MPVKEIGDKAAFTAELSGAGDKLVVVDFTATWCGPCQMIKPIFEEMSGTYTDVTFLKVDVDSNSETAQDCGVNCMPTFIFFKNGQQVHKMEGADVEGLKREVESRK